MIYLRFIVYSNNNNNKKKQFNSFIKIIIIINNINFITIVFCQIVLLYMDSIINQKENEISDKVEHILGHFLLNILKIILFFIKFQLN